METLKGKKPHERKETTREEKPRERRDYCEGRDLVSSGVGTGSLRKIGAKGAGSGKDRVSALNTSRAPRVPCPLCLGQCVCPLP